MYYENNTFLMALILIAFIGNSIMVDLLFHALTKKGDNET